MEMKHIGNYKLHGHNETIFMGQMVKRLLLTSPTQGMFLFMFLIFKDMAVGIWMKQFPYLGMVLMWILLSLEIIFIKHLINGQTMPNIIQNILLFSTKHL